MEHSEAFRRDPAAARPPVAGGLSVLILILLLTHPAAALAGARNGLMLWADTVLPTLLPFMICSNVIVSAGGLPVLMAPLRPFTKMLSLSEAGGYVLVSGLLCGFPMGAKTCAEFLAQGKISPEEARYLLAISNHPSPMFLLGYLAANLGGIPVAPVLASLYLPVFLLSALARRLYLPSRSTRMQDEEGTVPHPAGPDTVLDFDAVMMRSAEVMVRIGGYLMLFSVLAAFIRQVPFLPDAPKALLLGAAEITTGIRAVSETMSGFSKGFWLTAVTAFGGLSGVLQTKSVLSPDGTPSGPPPAKNAGLSIRHYILWKLLHTVTACLLYRFLHSLPVRLPR